MWRRRYPVRDQAKDPALAEVIIYDAYMGIHESYTGVYETYMEIPSSNHNLHPSAALEPVLLFSDTCQPWPEVSFDAQGVC